MNNIRRTCRSLDQLTVSHHAGPLLATLLRLCRCFVGICARFGRSRSENVEVAMSGIEDEIEMMVERRADDVTSSFGGIVAILITTT